MPRSNFYLIASILLLSVAFVYSEKIGICTYCNNLCTGNYKCQGVELGSCFNAKDACTNDEYGPAIITKVGDDVTITQYSDSSCNTVYGYVNTTCDACTAYNAFASCDYSAGFQLTGNMMLWAGVCALVTLIAM